MMYTKKSKLMNKMGKNTNKRAFTLTEVLLAMTIVGVLAVYTIPAVQKSFQKAVSQASFADTMKEANKGILNYAFSNTGITKLSTTDLFKGNDTAEKLSSRFRPQKTGTNCWEGTTIAANYDGSGARINLNNLSCFLDSDGVIYATETLSTDCSVDLYNKNDGTKSKLQNTCGILYFDTNGTKAPNAFGKDVFAFVITDATNSYLYPVGGRLMKAIPNGSLLSGVSSWENTCNENNKDGRACSGRMVEEGIKANYLK